MKLSAWRSSGARFDFRGHEIFYRSEGSGPALLLIHGFPTASWDWHRIWPQLTKRFRVVAPDMLGFGFSAKPRDHEYSIFEQADLFEALAVKLEISSAVILAHDYGDTVAQELLARHHEPDARIRLSSVCFLNGGLFPESHRPRPIQKLLLTPLGPLLGRLFNERAFRRSMRPLFGAATQPSAAELAELWRLVAENEGARIAHRLIRYLPERKKHRARWAGAMIASQIPLRLINGTADPVSGLQLVERYRALIPRPDVVVLENVGHYPQLEAPERVLAAFLETVPLGVSD